MGLFQSKKRASGDFIIPDNTTDINLLSSFGDTRTRWVFHSRDEADSNYGHVNISLENSEIVLDATASSKTDNAVYLCFPYKIDFSRFSKLQVVYERVSATDRVNFPSAQIYEDFSQFNTFYLMPQPNQSISSREGIVYKASYDNTNSSNVIKDITYKGVGVLTIGFYLHPEKYKITSIRLFN